ncbi:MAG: BACON domain-containing protein [Alistipes sp.]|nr:BACON domain-containing protein [Alistipes sp.]
MQNIKFLFLALILAVGIASCEKDNVTDGNAPQLKFEREEVGISANGGKVTVKYEVKNMAEDSSWKLNVQNDADWLTVDVAKDCEVIFSAGRNVAEEMRRADVVFSLEGAKDVKIAVMQGGGADPDKVSLEITSVDSTMITFNVKASREDLTWIPMVTYADGWEEPVDEDYIYTYDLAYFEYLSENAGVTLEIFLDEMLGVGSQDDIVIERLDPETEYVVYVYGLAKDGTRLTSIVWAKATTAEAWTGDITFAFEIEEEDFKLEYIVTPSHLGVDYYHGIAKASEIEAWKEATGSDDLATAIEYGDIEDTMKKLMDSNFIDSRADYFDMFNCYNVYDDGWADVEANTKYIVYAAKWDDDCHITGAVSTAEYTTPAAELSDNVITLEITEITQSSVSVEMKTTNDDPYVVIPVTASNIEGMTNEEIYTYIMDNYSVLVSEYTFSGGWAKTYGRMRPNTDYVILVFGNKAGVQTTAMQTIPFTTLPSGDPEDCTFDMLCVPADDNVWIQVIPSDKGHHYLYEVYPADFTEEMAKEFIEYVITNDYEGNVAAFSSWRLIQGDLVTTVEDLRPTTDYKLGVVIMDYDTGAFVTDVCFSEVFTTLEKTYANVSITVNWDKYFDAKALSEAGYTQFSNTDGCIVPVSVTLEGDYSEFYFAFYNKDLTDEVTYPDEIFYQDLQNNGYKQKSLLLNLPYDQLMTATGVIYDQGYNAGKVFRKAVTFTRRGASPVSEYAVGGTSASVSQSLVVLNLR